MPIHAGNYKLLQEHIHSCVGIVLENDKHYLFESRLSPIVKQLGLGSINDLCALLARGADPAIGRQVAEAMTTNETYFFRDPGQYEALRKVLFPQLKQEKGFVKKLGVWSAAASTGQEAYSVAMLLLENGFGDWNVEILGTDFSSLVLERARAGKYQQIEVNRGLPAALLLKYFRRSGVEWQLSDEVRQMVRFETIDLRAGMGMLGHFDIVLCRNILIYFDASTRKKILEELRATLLYGGWLLLGATETPAGVDQWFDKTEIEGATVYIAR